MSEAHTKVHYSLYNDSLNLLNELYLNGDQTYQLQADMNF